MIRCQLPAYSPLSPGKLLGAAVRAVGAPERAMDEMAELLRTRYGASGALLTSSGTHALQTALALASSTAPWAGRPVALPAYSCYDVVTAAVGAGVPVVFYDIDPQTLCPDAESVRRALGGGAGVLVANSLYGFPLDWSWLRSQCASSGALLVEDAAQGMGSAWQGSESGSFGDLTVLSFGRGKGWTGGGGGALLMRSGYLERPGAAQAVSSAALVASPARGNVRALALSLAQWALGRPWLYGIPSSIPALALGETLYKEPTPPARMAPFAAAAALAVVDLAHAEVAARRAAAAAWETLLLSDPGDFPKLERLVRPIEGGLCGYLRLPALARDAATREALVRSGRHLGLAAGYPKALPELPVLGARSTGTEQGPPGATELSRRLFTLPTHSWVTRQDRGGVATLLRRKPAE